MPTHSRSRRRFLSTTATLAAGFPFISRAADTSPVLGQGDFQYRAVPNWGNLGPDTPVNDCHGIVCDREGHLILLTNEVKNNFIVYDPNGKLLHKWGDQYPGAHGLSIVREDGQEFLYFTDLVRHMVFKSTLSGELLDEWRWPESNGKYSKEAEYKPSWTLHLPNGDFFVLDGYGRDFIMRYSAQGKLISTFGGEEGGVKHWGPHGGIIDPRNPAKPSLMLAMSDQQTLQHLDLDGKTLSTTPLPGGNPRQIHHRDSHFFIAHLADNWPTDRNSRGFVSILNKDLKVVSNIAGTPPIYNDHGILQKMKSTTPLFLHPHDLTIGKDGSLYVAQYASEKTYPIKLEQV